MSRPSKWLAVVLATSAVLVVASPANASPRATTFHVVVDGVAEILGSTCPFGDWRPAVATTCEDWHVLYFKESRPPQHRRAPWGVELVHARVVVHPDLRVDVLHEAAGVTYDLVGSFDERHLTGASVRAAVPLSDGTTGHVDLVWDGAEAPLQVAGNDGPFNIAGGFERHGVDRCFTFVRNAHQVYRANVGVTGVIDGTDVATFPYVAPFDPFLSRARFTFVGVNHGGCSD